MTWLFENPIPIVLIGAFSLAILIGGWLKTGSKSLVVAMVVVVALTLALVLVEHLIVTDREQVDLTLREIAALVERNDIDAALKHVHSGGQRIRDAASGELRNYTFAKVSITSTPEIKLLPARNPTQAVAEFNIVAVVSESTGTFTGVRAARFVSVTFRKEDGQWRVWEYNHDEPTAGMRIRP